MTMTHEQLLDAAVTCGLVDAEAADRLQSTARRQGADLLDLVTTHGRFPVAALYRALAAARDLPFVDLEGAVWSQPLVRRVPESLMVRHQVLPIAQESDGVRVATANPDDGQTISALQRVLGQPIHLAVADPESLASTIRRALAEARPGAAGIAAVPAAAPIDAVAALDRLLKEAFLRRASDIHLEPQDDRLRVRLRVDGRLRAYPAELGLGEGSSLVSRVKVLSGLDIAEQRAPQDGGFSCTLAGVQAVRIDIRVATSPTRWGERVTLRLLGLETEDLTLEGLGMSPNDLQVFRTVIRRPHGMILLTGPTGSGKTTTLYAALREINHPDRNILTVENPIEYVVPGISQVQVGEKVTFASALRSLLRHDPDILMVGEIRDAETADVAIKAAMTGHLVFSTLHANSACAAVSRLQDLECEPYLIGATLIAVIAQRLVRRLCPWCKRARPASAAELTWLGDASGDSPGVKVTPPIPTDVSLYEPVGCAHCLGSGFRGRIGLFEAFWIDRHISQQIGLGATQAELEMAVAGRMTHLREDGMTKALAGLTSLDDVIAATV